jgi:hypothetical protein
MLSRPCQAGLLRLSEVPNVPMRKLIARSTRNTIDKSQSFTRRNRSAFPITESELIVIAALAHIGLMRTPTIG